MSGFTVYPYISMRTEYLLQASQYVSATTNRFLASKTRMFFFFLKTKEIKIIIYILTNFEFFRKFQNNKNPKTKKTNRIV